MDATVQISPSLKAHHQRSVKILAWLHMLQSLALLGFAVYTVSSGGWVEALNETAIQYLPLALFDGMISAVVMMILALLGMAIGLAMLRLQSWAWLPAMSLQGLGLMAALYSYIRGRPNYVGMLIGIFLVFYLNQGEVQAAFRHAGPEGAEGPEK